jgi:hypothetical protein
MEYLEQSQQPADTIRWRLVVKHRIAHNAARAYTIIDRLLLILMGALKVKAGTGVLRRGPPALSRLPLTASRCTNAFDFGRAFRCASRVARPPFALGIGLLVADRLRLRFNRLGLRIADRLGQHLKQLRLGRFGRRCHLATISLSTSQLP